MRTEKFKGVLLSTLVIASVVMLALSFSFNGIVSALPGGLTPHDPIYIDGNAGFTPANGVTSGSGTENDPYIIENWDIRTEPWGMPFTGSFEPTDDAGVNNFGEPPNADVMYCGSASSWGIDAIVFFKFDLAGNIPAGAAIIQATLHFMIQDQSWELDPGILSIGEVPDDSWEEETIGWDTRPALGPVIPGAEIFYPLGYSGHVSADVTSYIISEFGGDGTASLWVYSLVDGPLVIISSKENPNPDERPYLEVTFAPIIPTDPGIEICNTTAHFVVRNCDVVHDGYADYTDGICFNNVINGKIDNNHVWNYNDGIYLDCSSNNTIANNTCGNSGTGICLYGSDNNLIYHNNFVNNSTHAYDDGTNYWDDGYPSGGNYWGDYVGVDENHGPNQDIPGPDGIGDTPYDISGGANQDRYPLMRAFGLATLYEINLNANLYLGMGSKLVLKFYTYAGAFEGENVVWSGSTPNHVILLEDIPHPQSTGVQKVMLVLTDAEGATISTLSTFTVRKCDLASRFSDIPSEWLLAPPDNRIKRAIEFSEIPSCWLLAPSC